MMRRTITGLLFLLAAQSAGCGVFGGQTGQEDRPDPCWSDEGKVSEPFGLDADAGLGLAPRDVLDRFAGAPTARLTWSRTGGVTELELHLTSHGDPRRLTAAAPLVCPAVIRIPGTLQVSTADGQLNESLAVELEAADPDVVTAVGSTPLSQLSGTWSAAAQDLDPSNWSAARLSFRFESQADGALFGFVSLDGGDPNPGDDATPVSAAIAEVVGP